MSTVVDPAMPHAKVPAPEKLESKELTGPDVPQMPGLKTIEVKDETGVAVLFFAPPGMPLKKVERIWAATYPSEQKYVAGMLRKKQPRQILEESERGVDIFTPKPPLPRVAKLRLRVAGWLQKLARIVRGDIVE